MNAREDRIRGATDDAVAEAAQEFPVSFAQKRLWFLEQLEGPGPAYNVRLPVRLRGTLDVECLQRAVDAVVDRHETLRTTFAARDGEPVQLVHGRMPVTVAVIDMAGAGEPELRERIGALAGAAFDLARGPLLRVFLARVSAEEHILLLLTHHIISDAWSSGVLFRDLAACYEAYTLGREPALPELPVQYADYAAWQRDWLRGDELERQVGFWQAHLAGAPPVLALPTDRPRPPVQTYRGSRIGHALGPALTAELKSLAVAEGATLFMVLFAAFNVLLARFSGQSDIVVGTPIAGRRRSELEGLVGFFANTLAIRTELGNAGRFRELLGQVRGSTLAAFAHQDLPFEKLVEAVKPPRELTTSPVFQVMFILQNTPWEESTLTTLKVSPAEMAPTNAAKFDLTVSAAEFESDLWLGLEYNSDLFDAATVERLAAGFATLLAAIVREPGAPLTTLPVQTAAERDLVLSTWNDTAAGIPDVTVYDLFAAQAARTPLAVAVQSGPVALTYGSLATRAGEIARGLAALGVPAGSPVAVCLERTVDLPAALLGVLRAGCHYVPLDPTHPPGRLGYILADSSARALLATASTRAAVVDFNGPVLLLDEMPGGRAADEGPAPRGSPADPAYLIYTSGSTGEPKGVRVPQRAVVNFLTGMARVPGMTSSDRLLAVTTPAFDIAVLELLLPLAVGATTIVAGRDEAADPVALMGLMASAGVTVMQATPATWRGLVLAGWRGLPSLKALCGGEALDRELATALRSRTGTLWNLYGPTETTVWSCCEQVVGDTGAVYIGRPIANTKCYVLDGQRQPVPIGVSGELWIGGAGVADGYHERAALTAERFVADAFASAAGARMYCTGDRARFAPDGRLEWLGRTDFQIKLRGFRIEPGEIEAVLATHPAVGTAAVIAREHAAGDSRLLAYVVPRGARPDADELQRHLRQRLPEYMIPSAFVLLDELPRTPNGKLDRQRLPAPEFDGSRAALAVAPRTPMEARLCGLFAAVLGRAEIGIHDDFFALGGHSLLATRLVSRIRDGLKVELPLKELFLAPTVAGVAAALPRAGGSVIDLPTGQLAASRESAPLSLVQQRLWFLDRLQPGNPVYNLAWAVELRGPLDRLALERALDAVVARHGVLRTRFSEQGGEGRQEIAAAGRITLDVLPAMEDQLQGALTELARRPFDLASGPLLRATLLPVDAGRQVLLLVVHHIIADGWSLAVLRRELTGAYGAFARGLEPDLPVLPLQYADYAVWQRDWLARGELVRQLDYWRGQLAGAPALLELPTDRPRPPVALHRGARVGRQLRAELRSGLHGLARDEGCTLFVVLLAAFDVLLGRYAGSDDVLVGTPVAGRQRAEIEGLIGFFVNTLVLRTDLRGNPAFREILARTKQMTIDAYAHQDVPFEQLVEDLKPPRSTGRSPLFQVMFNLHNEPAGSLSLSGLEATPIAIDRGTAKFDLTVSVTETEDGIFAGFEYSTELFDAPTIERLAEEYEALLEVVVRSPGQRLAELDFAAPPTLPAADVGELRAAAASTLPRAFAARAAATPDALAVKAWGQSCTYGKLADLAGRVASVLLASDGARGGGRGDRVGLCFGHGAGMVAGMLGVLDAGRVYVPLDPDAPPERLARQVASAGIRVVVTERSALAAADWLAGSGLGLVVIEELTGTGRPMGTGGAEPDGLAYVLYTSGSTGDPKGVPQTHRNVLHNVNAWARNLGLESHDRLSLLSGYGFDAAVQDIFGALLTGASVHPLDVRRLDRETLLDRVAGDGITVIHATPTVYRYLFGGHVACRQDLGRVRLVVLGGEAARRGDLDLFKARFRRGARFVNGYGLTESTVALQWFADHGTRAGGGLLPVGRPVGDMDVLLLDERGEVAGITGEIVLRSRYVTPGYWPATSGNPPAGAATIFSTGDLGRRLPDGQLAWLGRRDRQVKIAGNRIDLGEVEAAALRHPAVAECAVLSREETAGEPVLVAYYTGQGAVPGLRAHLRTILPDSLLPAHCVWLDGLPRKPNGKVDVARLPAPVVAAASISQQAPGTDVEATLVSLWRELLKLPAVGVNEDFFALGGHSLLATRLIARIRDRLGVELPLIVIFENPTIRGMAGAISRLPARAAPAAIRPREVHNGQQDPVRRSPRETTNGKTGDQ